MASPIDSIVKMPPWQRAVVWVVGAVVIGLVWYFLWYADAISQRESAERALAKADAELAKMQKKLENFEEEQRKAAEMEQEIRKLMEELPTSSATVDNMMQTFQQQARLVGLNVESWTPMGEEKMDYYAKLPVEIRAQGNWYALGEFMRRAGELKKIVSIEDLSLSADRKANENDPHPQLEVTFRAATYRFLTDEERMAAAQKASKRRRRGGGKK
ncbi:MAG: hypothetical protein D6705_00705 [Deltaproteobacteria bacterium]|nr:MAG: hypothetical protein D6705_00705 [Deltaproteobacteria bacterium]